MYYIPDQKEVDRLKNNIAHHAPHDDQAQKYGQNRSGATEFGLMLLTNCPPSRELSLALTKLEETLFWANAAIARNEK